MPKYRVAHVKKQGHDLIIFPLDPKFGQLSGTDQDRELRVLGAQANQAGLKGAPVAVWDAGYGRSGFRGPALYYNILSEINLQFVMANVNREISW